MTTHVTVLGSANIDIVIRAPSIPAPGETVLARDSERHHGGKGANQAVAAAKTGAVTELVAAFGNDTSGEVYRQKLSEFGVGTSACVTVPGAPTGTAFVTVDDRGENAIAVVTGANAYLTAETAIAAIDWSSSWLLTQFEVPISTVAAVLLVARDRGVRTALNASPASADISSIAALADLVIVNEHEFIAVADHPNVCVTRGASGAIWGGIIARPPQTEVVDSTGAGDVFAGTLVGHLALGVDSHTALTRAVESSAYAVRYLGAQGATK